MNVEPGIVPELRISPRARRVGVRVQAGGRVIVTVPKGCSYASVERFLRRHREWIARHARTMASVPPPMPKAESRHLYLRHREQARRLAYVLVARHASRYGVSVRTISIRDQRSRWGSCSTSGVLSFNYRIALLPERAAEYVVVHELCHLLEFNHSPRFWELVARAIPEHALIRKRLVSLDPPRPCPWDAGLPSPRLP
jgi:hypothetical protein